MAHSRFSRSLLAAAVVVVTSVVPAFGQVMNADGAPGTPAAHPGAIRDMVTGLLWLDATETNGRSLADVQSELGVGGEFEGWRVATRAEAETLYVNAGLTQTLKFINGTLTPTGASVGAAEQLAVVSFLNIFGIISTDPAQTGAFLWYAESDADDTCMRVVYNQSNDNFSVGDAGLAPGVGGVGLNTFGVALVRVPPIPSNVVNADGAPGTPASHPGAILDTVTGLLWLDANETNGRSVADVQSELGVGGEFEGWRIATRAETQALYANAGLVQNNNFLEPGSTLFQINVAQKVAVIAFHEIFGTTQSNPTLVGAYLWLEQSPVDGVFASITYRLAEDSYYVGDNGVNPDSGGTALFGWGVALVRSPPIPSNVVNANGAPGTPASHPGAILDTVTGLLWLDANETDGRSVADVQSELGVGGEFEGWRIATRAETQTLYVNAGLIQNNNFDTGAPLSFQINVAQKGAVIAFHEIFGTTQSNPTQVGAYLWLEQSPVDGVFASITYRLAEDSYYVGDNGVDPDFGGTALFGWGVALVRSPPVPTSIVNADGRFGTPPGHPGAILDTCTNNLWLDATETGGRSLADVESQLGPGGEFEGWSIATQAEVEELYANAGLILTNGVFVSDASQKQAVIAFLNVFGEIRGSPPVLGGKLWYADSAVDDQALSTLYSVDNDNYFVGPDEFSPGNGGLGQFGVAVALVRPLPETPVADLTTTGATLPGQTGFGLPDGTVDLDDLGYFLNFWLNSD